MDRPTCATCPYWFLTCEGDRQSLEHGATVHGSCRRHAPCGRVDAIVVSSYWCGEHPNFNAFLGHAKAPAAKFVAPRFLELAERFVNGESLVSIASSEGITPSAARTRIWRVFRNLNRDKYKLLESRYNRTPSSRQLRASAAEFGFSPATQPTAQP